MRRLTGKKGADVVIEHVGEATWERSILALALYVDPSLAACLWSVAYWAVLRAYSGHGWLDADDPAALAERGLAGLLSVIVRNAEELRSAVQRHYADALRPVASC